MVPIYFGQEVLQKSVNFQALFKSRVKWSKKFEDTASNPFECSVFLYFCKLYIKKQML